MIVQSTYDRMSLLISTHFSCVRRWFCQHSIHIKNHIKNLKPLNFLVLKSRQIEVLPALYLNWSINTASSNKPWPSGLKAPDLHCALWDVTYAVSYKAGSGAEVWTSVSYSRSRPGPRSVSALFSDLFNTVMKTFIYIFWLKRNKTNNSSCYQLCILCSFWSPTETKWFRRSEGGHGGVACTAEDKLAASDWNPS